MFTLQNYVITLFGLYLIILVRYFIIAGLFYWAYWIRPPHKIKAQRLQQIKPEKKVVQFEIFWSVISSFIYAVPGAYMLEAWKNGSTLIYNDITQYSWAYFFLSMGIYLVIHDTYFYWTHRLIHHPKLFKFFHKVHHNSRTPTPWAAFSFHYSEAILEAFTIPLLTFFIPINMGALLFLLTFMTLTGVINHTGYEVYPRFWVNSWFGRNVITSTHHNLHHSKYTCNYGLYFRIWDKIMKTDQWPEKPQKV